MPPRAFIFQPRGTNSFVRVTWNSSLGGKSKDHPPHFSARVLTTETLFNGQRDENVRAANNVGWFSLMEERFSAFITYLLQFHFDFLVKFKFRGTNFRDEKKSIDFTRPARKPLLKCFFLFVTWFPPSRGKTKSSLWLTSFCSIGLPGSHSSSPLGNLIYLNYMFCLFYIYI